MKTQESTRIHRFHDIIGISFTDTHQLYISPEDALAFSTELRRFAKNLQEKNWIATRIISKGKAKTERTGKSKVEFV